MVYTNDDLIIQNYRLGQITTELKRRQKDAVLVVDPVNLRYATGTRNMQVWTMHNISRYALITADADIIMFELPTGRHLSESIQTISDIRSSIPFDYFLVGYRAEEMATRWAAQILDVLSQYGCDLGQLAIDRADILMINSLGERHCQAIDGKSILEHARAIKSAHEIAAFRRSLKTCEDSVRSLHEYAVPGTKECEAFGHLLAQSIARGGEYPETRLLSSGPRTNPWFQEASDRQMQNGELLSFDTDLIGPMGFYNDISRSWVIGDRQFTHNQATLFDLSKAQLDHNINMLEPGMQFVEYASLAYQLPDSYLSNRYADIAHGCGLGVEYPFILYPEDAEAGMYDGVFKANMIVCVESYVGELHGSQGVKLEQPVLLTENGPEVLCQLPLDARDF